MNIEITPAGDSDYAIVRNLARFYMYDMAEHAVWAFDAEGNFDIGDAFNPFWGRERPSREWPADWKGHPFLARINGEVAGFALVTVKPDTIDMAEFFVARQYRRHNLGRTMATAMFDRFPGWWTVREMLTNVNAQAFWRRIINDYTGGDFLDVTETFAEYGGKTFITQRFRSGQHG